jgi:metal-dependent hydrolase (beta-lactamase superfamily II)
MYTFGKKHRIMKSNLKRTILALTFMMVAGANYVYGQCDKAITFKSSKTTMFDAEGKLDRVKDETTIVTISKSEIVIIPGGDDHRLGGTITSKTCDWSTPYKDGKMVIKGTLENTDGNEMHATLTIIGVGGKITLTFEAEEIGKRKIQVIADKFE